MPSPLTTSAPLTMPLCWGPKHVSPTGAGGSVPGLGSAEMRTERGSVLDLRPVMYLNLHCKRKDRKHRDIIQIRHSPLSGHQECHGAHMSATTCAP